MALSLTGAALGASSLLGWLLGSKALNHLAHGRPPMVPDTGGPGGVLVRRLGLAAFLASPALALTLILALDAIGLLDWPLLIATVTASMAVVMLAVLSITARSLGRTHEALERSRSRLQSFIEQAAEGVFVADLSGRYTDVNTAGCQMLGYSREEIIGKAITDLIPPQDVERILKVKEELLRGACLTGEWVLRRKDGRYLPVEVSAKILQDGRWQGLVRDISERKALERERLRVQERLDGIISIADDAIISVDEAQRIVIYNKGAEQTFGWTPDEVLGRSFEMLIPERFRPAHREHMRRLAEDPAHHRRAHGRPEIVGLRRSGEEFPAEAVISRLQEDGGLLFTMVLRDVTRQRRNLGEQEFLARVGVELASSLDYRETLTRVARLVVGFWGDLAVIDVVEEGGQARRLTAIHADPAKASLAEAVQRAGLSPQHPSPVWTVLRSRRSLLVAEVTAEMLRKNGRSSEHLALLEAIEARSMMVVPLIARGQLLGALSIVSSQAGRRYGASDLHLAEDLARRAALAVDNARLYRSAEQAVRTQEEVLHIVAHDLRNPLNAARLSTGTLSRRLRANDGDGDARRILDTIDRSLRRADRLIQDLLDIARIEGRRLSVDRVPIASEELIGEALDLLGPMAAEASLALEAEEMAHVPPVLADRERILQVFSNLIGNAIKFTPAGGRIRVAAERSDGEVHFSVTDTGLGFSPEQLGHLFDRYWQAKQTDRRGAGLGLSIAKGIVEVHGGRIWAESVPGAGSTFHFTLPVAPEEREASPSSSGT
jgi:PAS domain S-box-containing protein